MLIMPAVWILCFYSDSKSHGTLFISPSCHEEETIIQSNYENGINWRWTAIDLNWEEKNIDLRSNAERVRRDATDGRITR